MVVATISNQRIIITMTPPPLDFRPKNTADHKALNTSCVQKRIKATRPSVVSRPCCHTRNTEMAMRIYSSVQTGPNTRLGGVNTGFFNSGYQTVTDFPVNRLPITAAAKTAMILITNCMRLHLTSLPFIIAEMQLCFPLSVNFMTDRYLKVYWYLVSCIHFV